MKQHNLVEVISQKIEKDIYSGKLAPESKLPPERELAMNFNVSRPIVHNAVIKLQEKGLVRILPRHGVEVMDFRIHGKLSLLDSIVDLYKEELSGELRASLTGFFSANVNSIISLICINKYELSNLIYEIPNAIRHAENEEEASNLFLEFYHTLSIDSGNEIFPLLINTMKLGIINVSKYMLKSEEHRCNCADVLEKLTDALEKHLYSVAVSINGDLLDMAIKLWR